MGEVYSNPASGGAIAAGRYRMSPFWRDLPAGWTEISTSGTQPALGMLAYSGMALNSADGKLYFFGGGHNDYFGNDVCELDIESFAWNQHYLPDLTVNPELASAQAVTDNINFPGAIVIGGDPLRPISRHTYKSVHWIPSLGVITAGGGSTYSGTGDYLWYENAGAWLNDPRDFWTYNPVAKTWSYKGSARTNLTNFWATRSAAHPHDGNVYCLNPDVNGYLKCSVTSASTGATTVRSGILNDQVTALVAPVFDQVGRYLYALTQQYYATGQIRLVRYDTQTDSFLVMPVNGGSVPPFQYNESFHIAYSSKTHRIYALNNQSDGLHIYDIATGVWSSQPLPLLTLFLQVDGRFIYDHKRQAAILVYAGQYTGMRVFAFKD